MQLVAAAHPLLASSSHPKTSHPRPTCSHGSRPSSRIGALHGPGGGGSSAGSTPCSGSPNAGGSPPLLATQERAARHAELSAERRKREEAEAAAHEAERLAQLVRAGLQVVCGGRAVAGVCVSLHALLWTRVDAPVQVKQPYLTVVLRACSRWRSERRRRSVQRTTSRWGGVGWWVG